MQNQIDIEEQTQDQTVQIRTGETLEDISTNYTTWSGRLSKPPLRYSSS